MKLLIIVLMFFLFLLLGSYLMGHSGIQHQYETDESISAEFMMNGEWKHIVFEDNVSAILNVTKVEGGTT